MPFNIEFEEVPGNGIIVKCDDSMGAFCNLIMQLNSIISMEELFQALALLKRGEIEQFPVGQDLAWAIVTRNQVHIEDMFGGQNIITLFEFEYEIQRYYEVVKRVHSKNNPS